MEIVGLSTRFSVLPHLSSFKQESEVIISLFVNDKPLYVQARMTRDIYDDCPASFMLESRKVS